MEGGVSFWQVDVGGALCVLCSVSDSNICSKFDQSTKDDTENRGMVDVGSNKHKRTSDKKIQQKRSNCTEYLDWLRRRDREVPNGPTDVMQRGCKRQRNAHNCSEAQKRYGPRSTSSRSWRACTHTNEWASVYSAILLYQRTARFLAFRVGGKQYRNAIAFILEANREGGEAGWAGLDQKCAR